MLIMNPRAILPLLLFAAAFSSCWRSGALYPVQGETRQSYGIPLSKKEQINSLKDSLFSAFILPDTVKSESPSQRKKAVDSTFIRFGRSSVTMENGGMPDSMHLDEALTSADYYDGINKKKQFYDIQDSDGDQVLPKSSRNNLSDHPNQTVLQQQSDDSDNGLRETKSSDLYLVKKRDFYRLLMMKSCSRSTAKVKRENVNDTFIRFGKRSIPENAMKSAEVSGTDRYDR